MEEIMKLCINETIEILKKDSPTYFDIHRAITLLNCISSLQLETDKT